MARVPVVALGPRLGRRPGRGAARRQPLLGDDPRLPRCSSQVPPVVKRLGQDLTKQELGGWEIQTRAGGVDDAVETEEEAFARARRFLSYLPSSVYELPPTIACDDDPERAEERCSAMPRNRRQVYKMRPIIEPGRQGLVLRDGREFRPLDHHRARAARGPRGAVMACDPFHYGGSWTADACQKVIRFVDLAETFHLPVVYLIDCPGFVVGLEAEKTATIRDGVRAMAAVNQTDGTVVHGHRAQRLRRRRRGASAGGAAIRCAMPGRRLSGDRCRWKAASRRPIAPDIDAQRIRRRSWRRSRPAQQLRSPFRTAETFWVEEIIDPRKTRSLLCEFARLAEPLRTPGPRAVHHELTSPRCAGRGGIAQRSG